MNAILAELVTGRTAGDKGFAPIIWRYGNDFIAAMVDGYLSGDGHHDTANSRWRLGFTRNYNLERDLRTACARLGYSLALNLSHVRYNGSRRPTFRGELRKTRSGHHNEKPLTAVVAIRKARCRNVYDIGVEDEPHVFSLASGVLTHNSKRNPMPESVKDRCTKAHEYVFLLTKSARYWWDAEAIKEPQSQATFDRFGTDGSRTGSGPKQVNSPNGLIRDKATCARAILPNGRNCRSVWEFSTLPTPEAHFATYPIELPERCILAGCPPNCVVLDPFAGAGTTWLAALKHGRRFVGVELNPEYIAIAEKRIGDRMPLLAGGADVA